MRHSPICGWMVSKRSRSIRRLRSDDPLPGCRPVLLRQAALHPVPDHDAGSDPGAGLHHHRPGGRPLLRRAQEARGQKQEGDGVLIKQRAKDKDGGRSHV